LPEEIALAELRFRLPIQDQRDGRGRAFVRGDINQESLADDYHKQWRSFFAVLTVKKEKLTSSMYDSLPKFEYHEEPITDVLARTTTALVVLFSSGVAIGAIGIHRLKKFPIAG
jgi:hypothetical protein